MYDATKIKIGYTLNDGEEIDIDNSDITLSINENTIENKKFRWCIIGQHNRWNIRGLDIQ